LSAPEILTLNNQRAVINVSTSFDYASQFQAISNPIIVGGGGQTNTTSGFLPTQWDSVNVGFFLEVVPSVGRDMKTIVLDLHPVVDELDNSEDFDSFRTFDFAVSTGGAGATQQVPRPVVATRELTTKLVIEDGMTIVLGGLMRDRKVKVIKKVPILGDIPLLGLLFRSTSDTIEKSNLIIIVRAQIVTPAGQTYYDVPPELEEQEEAGEGEVQVGEAPATGAKTAARLLRQATTLRRVSDSTRQLALRARGEQWFAYDEAPRQKVRTQTFAAPEK
jgi:type II secretory pathway component GspD/PulD (secretin)